MKHTLTITFPAGVFRPRVYLSSQEAHDAARTVHDLVEEGISYTVTPVMDPINGWTPDAAEQDLLRATLNKGNKVAPIKYVRTRAQCGLKEAKDWIDTQMADAYVPGTWTADPPRY